VAANNRTRLARVRDIEKGPAERLLVAIELSNLSNIPAEIALTTAHA